MNSSPPLREDILILLYPSSGSSDFDGGTHPFTIPPNEEGTTVSIPITDDDIVERLREEFSLSLSVQPQPGVNMGNSETSVTIIDDDGKSDKT